MKQEEKRLMLERREHLNLRYIEESIFKAGMILSVFVVMASLLAIFGTVIIKGGSSLSFEMLTRTPTGSYYLGKGGGILNAIAGSLLLAIPATLIAYIISLGLALFLQREFTHPKAASLIRLSLDILWGTPSIVYGIFCLTVMVLVGLGTSLLAGIIALTLLEIPIITRSIDDALRNVPDGLREASYSLGSTRIETVFSIVRRQAHPGIVSGILLGFGRGIGDAASILFTAGFSDRIPLSLMDATAALPTMIFNLFSSPIAAVRERAYASAFILLVIVLIISSAARALTKSSVKSMV